MEDAAGHLGVAVAADAHTRHIVDETRPVDGDGIGIARGGGTDGRAETGERAVGVGGEVTVAVRAGHGVVAVRPHLEARVDGADGRLARMALRAHVLKAAAGEAHALHVPHRHMRQEVRVVGGEEVVVVHRERAVPERAPVVVHKTGVCCVGVGQVLHGLGTVAEGRAVGGDDAAGTLRLVKVGGSAALRRNGGGDAAQGVLDDGPVEELHGALVGGGLRQVGVPLHADTMPHLALTGAGQRTTIHDELAARTHDDAGGWGAKQCICDCQRGERVNDQITMDNTGLFPSRIRNNTVILIFKKGPEQLGLAWQQLYGYRTVLRTSPVFQHIQQNNLP